MYYFDCVLNFINKMIAAWLFMKMINDVLCWMYYSAMLKFRTSSCNSIAYIMTVLFSSTSRFLFTFRFKTMMITFTLSLMILSFMYIISWLESLTISSCSFNAVFLLSVILNLNKILQRKVIIEYMHFIKFNVSNCTWSCALYLFLSFLKRLQNLKFLNVNIMYCLTFFIWSYIWLIQSLINVFSRIFFSACFTDSRCSFIFKVDSEMFLNASVMIWAAHFCIVINDLMIAFFNLMISKSFSKLFYNEQVCRSFNTMQIK